LELTTKKITDEANGERLQKHTGQYCCLCWAVGREWKSASKTAITPLTETETKKRISLTTESVGSSSYADAL